MSGMKRFLCGLALGLVVAHLWDPDNGRSRRLRLVDRFAARLRRGVDEASARARYEVGRAQGAVHEAGPARDFPADDAELLQKVRSEALGPSGVSTAQLEIHVNDGEVTVRGVSPGPDEERDLMSRIEGVTGVRRVRNELRS